MDIAIVGIGCRFPGGADDPVAFWELLREGVDAIGELPADRFDLEALFDPDPGAPGRIYTRWGGFLDGIDRFDAEFFGIAPREARRMDPQQRLLLELVWEAFEDGGQVPDELRGSATGVFVGVSTRDYIDAQVLPLHPERIDAHVNAGTALSIAANRVSYLFDLHGPSLAVDTACSSSLTAVHLACRSLANDECDLAVAGGVGILLAPEVTVGFCKASMLSPSGRCRAFDAAADGYVRSEGGGVVVLKPLQAAEAAGDPIHAVIRGSAVNSDGRTTGLSLPSEPAQRAMLRRALRDARVDARDVAYVEAHGTGTPAGDPIEARAIGRVLAEGRDHDSPVLLGSVKTNIGHLEAAAGMAGLIKATLALERRQVPANLHFDQPNAQIPFDELRLRVPTHLEDLPAGSRPLFAGVNSFGFGGANAHVVLAPPPPVVPAPTTAVDPDGPHLVALSAHSPEALGDAGERLAEHLESHPELCLTDLEHTTTRRRTHHRHRLALLASSPLEVVEGLRTLRADDGDPRVIRGRATSDGREPLLAFVCTGMGPQWWGMGRELLRAEPVFRERLEQVDAELRPLAGWSLFDHVGTDERRSRASDPDVAHVANFALQIALSALWASWGVRPDTVVGHSSGEMAAACIAGALSLPDAVRLAFHRGRLQARTHGTGRMLAVAISAEEATGLVGGLEDRVAVAAINAPGSVTLSGDADVLGELSDRLHEEGRFARFLPVDVPYHGPQMETIREPFLAAVTDLSPRDSELPLVSATLGTPVDGCALDADYWWRNVRQPVRFSSAIEHLTETGTTLFVELGPHPVLAAAIGECCLGDEVEVFASLHRDAGEIESLSRTLAGLHVHGRRVDLTRGRAPARCVPLPTYPWQRERHWFDADEAAPSATRPVGVDTGHPLLGRRLPVADPVWETRFDTPQSAYLDAHVVQDATLFPGAGYVEQTLAVAAALWGPSPVVIEDLSFRRLLFLPHPRRTAVQISYQPEGRRVAVRSDIQGDGTDWVLHAEGRFDTDVRTSLEPVDVEALRARCTIPLEIEDHYAALESRGYGFGPAFRTLRRIRLGSDGEALAEVGFPPGEDHPMGPHRIHPALLDAAIQLFGAVSARDLDLRDDAPFFPVRVDRFTFHRSPGTQLLAHVEVRPHDAGRLEGSATLFESDGTVVAAIEGLHLEVLDDTRRVEEVADWLYELRWEPEPLPDDRAAAVLATPSEVAAGLEAAAGTIDDVIEVGAYLETVEPTLDRLALDYAMAAFLDLGWNPADPLADPVTTATTLGVVEEHRRLATALLRNLEEAVGIPPRDGRRLRPDPARAHRELDALAAAQPDHAAEVELVRRGGSVLADVLRGRIDAREVLLADDSLELMERFYRDSPPCRDYHRLLARAVGSCRTDEHDERPLRVLEVGGGTGSATSALLDELAGTVEYTFTDVSPQFLAAAEQFDGRDVDLHRARLDLEVDPTVQGFAPASFDVVVAANVLHVTRDLDAALGHVRTLLRPGGILTMLELGRGARWLNVVFGLLEGWWRATDVHRGSQGPMLDAAGWHRVLDANGFTDVATLFDDAGGDEPVQSILLAQAPVTREDPSSPAEAAHSTRDPESALPRPPARRRLLLADRRGVGTRLADVLEDAGEDVVLVHRDELPGGANDPAGLAEMLEEVTTAGELHGVVHLWSLDLPRDAEDRDGMSLLDDQAVAAGSALALVHALESCGRHPAELCLVTAGAQSVPATTPGDPAPSAVGDAAGTLDEEEPGAPSPSAATLWGLGRVVTSEYAHARCRLVDLPAEPGPGDVASLATELLGDAPEEEVAFRSGARHVHRLRRVELAEHVRQGAWRRREPDRDVFRLEVASPGALGSLHLRDADPAPPGAGEVGVRVRASGLNFRDVLQSLDMLPSAAYQYDVDPEALGIECAGVVHAVGDGVHRFRPGDEVMTLTAAAHASQVVARDELVVAKPPDLGFAEAASVLNAFVTAQYALHDVARIAPGERVLVHSATGAVGLAAIQLCLEHDVEVFATAGTPEKRAHLTGLDVRHVMDSRSLAFADEILDVTDGEGVDVVLNSLTGEATLKGLSVLRRYGRFVELGKRDIYADARVGLLPFERNLSFHAVDLIQLALDRPERARALLELVAERLVAKRWRPVPVTAFDLADCEAAFRLMAQARHVGKIVLTVDEPSYLVRERARPTRIREDGTYLVTGGLGGVGLSIARRLVDAGARHLVLLSRTGRPKEAPDTLASLRASGADVRVECIDVTDHLALRRLLDDVRRELPPLRGVIHAAMVLDDDMLVRLDDARFRAVLAPKLAGAWNLHRLTSDDDLDLFVLFSSMASVLGHPMQGNYAAANAFLDALAGYRQAQGRPGLSIGWGAIDGVGYVARHGAVADYLHGAGFRGMEVDEAFDTLETVLRHDLSHVMAARIDWDAWARANPLASTTPNFEAILDGLSSDRTPGDTTDQASIVTRLQRESRDRGGLLTDHLRQQVAQVLGTDAERIDPERPLTELGFDSLMAVELTSAFTTAFGVRVAVVEILQGASCRSLSDLLLDRLELDDPSEGDEPAGAFGAPDDSEAAEAAAPSEPAETAGPSEPAGTLDAASDHHPLSFEQRRFWYLDQVSGSDPGYHVPVVARLRGELDVRVLGEALDAVVERHEVLRARIEEIGGEPRQRFVEPIAVPLPVTDVGHLSAPERESAVETAARGQVLEAFDLGAGMLLRARLLRLADREHVLLLVVHHLAGDAWSLNLVIRELAVVYEALRRGRAPLLDPRPPRYVDYVHEQRRTVDAIADEQLDYWRRQLRGARGALDLPVTRTATTHGPRRGARHDLELGAELSEALEDFSRRRGVTLFMTLLTAFQAVLHRLTGAHDLCVGTAVSTRTRPGFETVAGCCLNTLVLRAEVRDQATLDELLAQAQATTLAALEHQEVPFERVVNAVRHDRGGEDGSLFEAMLVLHNARIPALEVEGLEVTTLELDDGTATADLVLAVDTGSRLAGAIQYDLDRVGASTVSRLAAALLAVLQALVTDPSRRLADLPLDEVADATPPTPTTTAVAAAGLVRDPVAVRGPVGEAIGAEAVGAGDSVSHSPVCRLDELVLQQVAHSPDTVAVTADRVEMSYAELHARAAHLADRLRRHGIGPASVVGVQLPRSPGLVVAALGVMMAEGIYLPLDPTQPLARRRRILTHADPAVVLAAAPTADVPSGDAPPTWLMDPVTGRIAPEGPDTDDGPAPTDPSRTNRQADDEAPAYLVPTSGTTGEPKLVIVPHRAIVRQVLWRQRLAPLDATDAVLLRTPIGFDPSIWELFGPLTTGARLVVVPEGVELDAAGEIELIASEEVTALQAVPSVLQTLLEQPGSGACRSLRHVFSGGEPLSGAVQRQIAATWGQATVHHLYGPAEATIDATVWTCVPGQVEEIAPIGRPVDHLDAEVVDPSGRPAPVGVAGELLLSGDGIALGYLGADVATGHSFGRHPRSPDRPCFWTGDLARRRDDGALEFLGRRDEQVNVRGVRVEPGEVEAALLRHPAVTAAAVVAPHVTDRGRRLVAYVTLARPATVEDLQTHAARELPSSFRPDQVVVLAALPITPSGKVDRVQLRRLAASRARPPHAIREPSGNTERALLEIWRDLLPDRTIGVTDDFFALGGHSLLAMRLMAKIEHGLGRRLPVSTLIGHRTIAALATHLDRQPPPPGPLVTVRADGERAPLFLVHAVEGSGWCYRPLVAALGNDRPIHLLEAVGLQGDHADTSIDAMARRYATAVEHVPSAGPYLIGGWSMGGVVAQHLAHHLEARGHRASLLLLDTGAPGRPGAMTDRVEQLSRACAAAVDGDEQPLAPLVAELATLAGGDPAWWTGTFPIHGNGAEARTELLRRLKVIDHHLRAMREHRPRPTAGPAVSFDTALPVRGPGTTPSTGWDELIRDGVTHVHVPGDHHTLLRPPQVLDLASQMRSWLRRLEPTAGAADR